MRNPVLTIFFLILNSTCSHSQNLTLHYRSPLGIPLELAANFGEIRPDHFHMGVDFKTNGKEGLTIYAIERGFVSRVKISPDGYGKSIYIDHPDGRTSVYAHCSVLKGRIDSLVKAIQTEEQNFEVDIYFRPTDLPILKGQVIALSGNTGHSFAPHLHFEIRDTKTEDALNPLLYGFDAPDHKKPEIHGMRIYALSEEGYPIPGKSMKVGLKLNGKNYVSNPETVEVPSNYFDYGPIGLAFETSDHLDRGMNTCGIFEARLLKNGSDLFVQRMDRVSFSETRYVNDHVDYERYNKQDEEWQKAFTSQSNPLNIYKTGNGWIMLEPEQLEPFEFTVSDTKGNKNLVSFKLKRHEGTKNQFQKKYFTSELDFMPDSSYSALNENSMVFIKPHTFYQPAAKKISLGNVITISTASIPVQFPVEVGFKIPSDKLQEKGWYISRTKVNGRAASIDSRINGGWIYGETKAVGNFQLKQDVTPPNISPRGFDKQQLITQKQLRWSVSELTTDLRDYDLFLNNQWYLIEFERKGNYLIFNVPSSLKGKKTAELIVTDQCGNKAVWKGSLTF